MPMKAPMSRALILGLLTGPASAGFADMLDGEGAVDLFNDPDQLQVLSTFAADGPWHGDHGHWHSPTWDDASTIPFHTGLDRRSTTGPSDPAVGRRGTNVALNQNAVVQKGSKARRGSSQSSLQRKGASPVIYANRYGGASASSSSSNSNSNGSLRNLIHKALCPCSWCQDGSRNRGGYVAPRPQPQQPYYYVQPSQQQQPCYYQQPQSQPYYYVQPQSAQQPAQPQGQQCPPYNGGSSPSPSNVAPDASNTDSGIPSYDDDGEGDDSGPAAATPSTGAQPSGGSGGEVAPPTDGQPLPTGYIPPSGPSDQPPNDGQPTPAAPANAPIPAGGPAPQQGQSAPPSTGPPGDAYGAPDGSTDGGATANSSTNAQPQESDPNGQEAQPGGADDQATGAGTGAPLDAGKSSPTMNLIAQHNPSSDSHTSPPSNDTGRQQHLLQQQLQQQQQQRQIHQYQQWQQQQLLQQQQQQQQQQQLWQQRQQQQQEQLQRDRILQLQRIQQPQQQLPHTKAMFDGHAPQETGQASTKGMSKESLAAPYSEALAGAPAGLIAHEDHSQNNLLRKVQAQQQQIIQAQLRAEATLRAQETSAATQVPDSIWLEEIKRFYDAELRYQRAEDARKLADERAERAERALQEERRLIIEQKRPALTQEEFVDHRKPQPNNERSANTDQMQTQADRLSGDSPDHQKRVQQQKSPLVIPQKAATQIGPGLEQTQRQDGDGFDNRRASLAPPQSHGRHDFADLNVLSNSREAATSLDKNRKAALQQGRNTQPSNSDAASAWSPADAKNMQPAGPVHGGETSFIRQASFVQQSARPQYDYRVKSTLGPGAAHPNEMQRDGTQRVEEARNGGQSAPQRSYGPAQAAQLRMYPQNDSDLDHTLETAPETAVLRTGSNQRKPAQRNPQQLVSGEPFGTSDGLAPQAHNSRAAQHRVSEQEKARRQGLATPLEVASSNSRLLKSDVASPPVKQSQNKLSLAAQPPAPIQPGVAAELLPSERFIPDTHAAGVSPMLAPPSNQPQQPQPQPQQRQQDAAGSVVRGQDEFMPLVATQPMQVAQAQAGRQGQAFDPLYAKGQSQRSTVARAESVASSTRLSANRASEDAAIDLAGPVSGEGASLGTKLAALPSDSLLHDSTAASFLPSEDQRHPSERATKRTWLNIFDKLKI